MRKILSVILAFIMIIGCMSVNVFAAGNAATINGVGYESLSAAIEAANDGDNIILNQDIDRLPTITKAVTIEGADSENYVKINAGNGENQFDTIDGTVTFRYLEFTNASEAVRTDYSSEDYSKLTLVYDYCNFYNIVNTYAVMGGASWNNHLLSGLTITNCNFEASSSAYTANYMIYAQCVNNVTIQDCVMDGGNSYRGAIHLGDSTQYATNALISGNTIKNFARGVQVGNRGTEGTSSIAITGNTFTDIQYNAMDSKKSYESVPVFIHGNADAAQITELTVTNNEFTGTNENGMVVYSENSTPAVDMITAYSGNTGVDSELENVVFVLTPETEGADLIIKTKNELAAFAKSVNSGNTYAGKTVVLAADIDLENMEWNPIGNGEYTTSNNIFKGTFNGNDYTVSNLNIPEAYHVSGGSSTYAGFFGKIVDGTVKNLKLDNVTIAASSNAGDFTVIGALAGQAYTGTIENVQVTNLNITDEAMAKYIGGITGHGYAAISNCRVEGTISPYAAAQLGGIIGMQAGAYIKNCYVNAAISGGYTIAGGIIGFANGSEGADGVENCYFTGSIEHHTPYYDGPDGAGSNVGGIVGTGWGIGNYYTAVNCFADADFVDRNGNAVDSKNAQYIFANCGGDYGTKEVYVMENCGWVGDQSYTWYGYQNNENGTNAYAIGENSELCSYDAGLSYIEYLARGSETPVSSGAVVEFIPVDEADEYTTYEIAITAKDDYILNVVSAEMNINLDDADVKANGMNVSYEVYGANDFQISQDSVSGKYLFNLPQGEDSTIDNKSGEQVVIGELKVSGYTNKIYDTAPVYATVNVTNAFYNYKQFENSLAKVELLIDDSNVDYTKVVAAQKLTVNVEFPNSVDDNEYAYQAMTVTISGGDLAADITANLGTGEKAMENGKYTVTADLTRNIAYNITVKGAGYRTARYTVTMTDDKTVTFWNNVMDDNKAMEVNEVTAEEKGAAKLNFLAGDIVADNNINIYDLSAVVSYFATSNDTSAYSDYAKYDLNRDGVIDSKDVAYVLVSWNN